MVISCNSLGNIGFVYILVPFLEIVCLASKSDNPLKQPQICGTISK